MVKAILYSCLLVTGFVLHASDAAAQPGSPDKIRLTANLTGGEETPAPGFNTGAFGVASVEIDTRDATEVTVSLQVWNLPTGSTAGHIHAGSRGTPGPVILDFLLPTGRTGDFSVQLRLGQAQFRARPEIGIVTLADAIQAVAAGNGYVNVHTTQYPGGEIRGQLTLVSPGR